jgi:hypothetical protein
MEVKTGILFEGEEFIADDVWEQGIVRNILDLR